MKPTVSLQAKKFIRSFPADKQKMCWLFLVAKAWNIDLRDINPSDFRDFDVFPKTHVFNQEVPEIWIKEWTSLWPTPATCREWGCDISYNPRCAWKENLKRMQVFVKEFNSRLEVNYDLSDVLETIRKATTRYLLWKMNNCDYPPKKSIKFIKELEGSQLEDWCRKEIEGVVEEAPSITSF